MPAFSDALVARIEPQLERAGSVGNPVDIIDGADGLASFTGIVRACLESGEVDAVLLTGYYGGYALYSDDYRDVGAARGARAWRRCRRELDRPIVVHSIFADAVGDGTDLRAHGLASYERGEQAVRALAALATPPPLPAVAAPPPAAPLRGAPGYVEARALLLEAGIAYGDGGPARDADEAAVRRASSGSTPSRSRPSTPGSCTSRTPAACASGSPTPASCARPRPR